MPAREFNICQCFAETYRPIAEIVAELDAIELEARKTDKELRSILKKLGVAS
jgi:type I restriction enzyme M protein